MTTLDGGQDGVWISISELARRKGIHRQSAMEKVDRLVAKGALTTRSEGRSRLVDLAAFDRAVGVAGDAAKEQGEQTKREAEAPASPKLRDAQTERAQYEARLKALDLQERLGNLLPVKGEQGVERAMIRAAEVILRAVDDVPGWAADIIAVAKDGQPAVARILRDKRHQLRVKIAAALTGLKDEGMQAEADGGVAVEIAEG